ncbi:hypothetical protein Salat_0498100 [Sesamum alatum]|uniref:Uncharacterized protein n=1 Tax=Sesamum alatum TaxID=300844 RepID=A0AAE2D0M4_9LAMI|nr:hypothetical protein Salat_0498100 [Sesamum alatum]
MGLRKQQLGQQAQSQGCERPSGPTALSNVQGVRLTRNFYGSGPNHVSHSALETSGPFSENVARTQARFTSNFLAPDEISSPLGSPFPEQVGSEGGSVGVGCSSSDGLEAGGQFVSQVGSASPSHSASKESDCAQPRSPSTILELSSIQPRSVSLGMDMGDLGATEGEVWFQFQ